MLLRLIDNEALEATHVELSTTLPMPLVADATQRWATLLETTHPQLALEPVENHALAQ